MMKKRLVALLLVLAMVLSCLPISVLAEEITEALPEIDTVQEDVQEEEETPETNTQEAVQNTDDINLTAANSTETADLETKQVYFVTKDTFAEMPKMTKLYFGSENKIWDYAFIEDNALVLLCDLSNPYGTSQHGTQKQYDESVVEKAVTALYADGSQYFSTAEIGLMKEVTLHRSKDNRFGTFKRKMYLPAAWSFKSFRVTNTIFLTDRDTTGVKLSELPNSTAQFWLRTEADDINSVLESVDMNSRRIKSALATDVKNILPVVNLNMANMLFASKVNGAADGGTFQDGLTLRYNGGNYVGYKAEYNSTRINVSVNEDCTAFTDNYLVVQWSSDSEQQVKTIPLDRTGKGTKVTAEEIGGAGFTIPSDAKVWVEKKNTDENLIYAIMGTKIKEEGPDAPKLTEGRTTKNGASDGKITGLDATKIYEYAQEDGENKTWKKLKAGTTELTGLKAGNYYFRVAETDTHQAGKTALCKVYERFDVTIKTVEGESDQKVEINGKAAATYVAKQILDVAYTYAEKTSVSATIGAQIGTGLIDLISGKFIKQGGQDPIYKQVKEIKTAIDGISTDIANLSTQMQDEFKDIQDAKDDFARQNSVVEFSNMANNIDTKYYSGSNQLAIDQIGQFYNGEMNNDQSSEATNIKIDNTLHHYFCADANKNLKVSLMTQSDYLDTNTLGRDFYNDFMSFGKKMLGIEAIGTGAKAEDIFELYEDIQSYKVIFNPDTFSGREAFNQNAYIFYEKGYALLATAISYEITTHQNILEEIAALEAKQATLPKDSEEYLAIEKEFDEIIKEAQSKYHWEAKTITLSRVKQQHQNIVDMDKADLKALTTQYNRVAEKKDGASNGLNTEKDRYSNQGIIYCYRTEQAYYTTLKCVSVNQDYIAKGLVNKSDAGSYFNYRYTQSEAWWTNRVMNTAKYTCYYLDSLKYPQLLGLSDDKNPDSVFKDSVSTKKLNYMTTCCKNRNTSVEKEFQKYFNYQDYVGSDKTVHAYKDFGTSSLQKNYKGLYTEGNNTCTNISLENSTKYLKFKENGKTVRRNFNDLANQEKQLERQVTYKKDLSSQDVTKNAYRTYTTRRYKWYTEAPNVPEFYDANAYAKTVNTSNDQVLVLCKAPMEGEDEEEVIDESTVLGNSLNPSTRSSGYNGTLILTMLFFIAALIGSVYCIGKKCQEKEEMIK